MVFNRYSIMRVAVTVAAVLFCGEVSAEQSREGQIHFSVVTPGGIPQQETLDMSTAESTPAVASGNVYGKDPSLKEQSAIHNALPYAILSNEIYKHNKEDDNKTGIEIIDNHGNKWKRLLSERGELTYNYNYTYEKCLSPSGTAMSTPPIAGMKEECTKETLTKTKNISDPTGFHAEFYTRGNNQSVIVFEGTNPSSIKDLSTDLRQLVIYPGQFKAAHDFVEKVLSSEYCRSVKKCQDIVVTGHSLGGALAQYVALSRGLKSYVFNSAGLGVITRAFFNPVMADNAEIIGLVGQGYHKGHVAGFSDVIEKTGKQYYKEPIGVPIDIPFIRLDSIGQISILLRMHKMENMLSSLREIDRSYHMQSQEMSNATALIIDRSGSMIGILNKLPLAGGATHSSRKADLEKLEKAKEAAKSYILSRGGNDLVSVSTFSNSGSTELALESVSMAKRKIDETLNKINAAGGTNMGAGLEQGYTQLSKESQANKMAILLSDGVNTTGNWRPAVKKFQEQGWPVCTIGFGTDADEKTLRSIAEDTGCTYEYADTVDIVNKYQSLSAYAEGKSPILAVNDSLTPQGKVSYPFYVSKPATILNIFTSWQGSKLKSKLTMPDGRVWNNGIISTGNSRYEEGDTFQMLEIEVPSPGKWSIELSWEIPPTEAEQVNTLIAEKSDVFGRIHGFRPQYSVGEAVAIKVDANEMLGLKKVPLSSTSISVQIQKPGPQMIRMVKAQSSNWTMYKDVVLDVTRNVALYDDGKHDDYKAGDGIFGGTYTETDKNGAYLVTARIKAKKQDGQSIEKTLISSFQVGKITQNQVTTSQTLQYREEANLHIDTSTPYSDELLQQPLDRIERMQNNPLDNIDKLLN